MTKKNIIQLAVCFFISTVNGQILKDRVQTGMSIKVQLDLFSNSKKEPCLNLKVATSVGAGSRWLTDELYPTVNADFLLYNGGIGSKSTIGNQSITFDAIFAFTLTYGHLYSDYNGYVSQRNVPLHYFGDFSKPSLQNPFNYSASLGTNLIFSSDRDRTFQRVGFVNFNHSGVQLSYYNDGTPFQHLLLGDGKDRYYTGGASIAYSRGYGEPQQIDSYSFELSYHKFSGFNENSFELGYTMNNSIVDYVEETQSEYNKSLWHFNVSSSNRQNNIGLSFCNYNSVALDVQHLIHTLIDCPYHIVPYQNYMNLEPSFSINSKPFTQP